MASEIFDYTLTAGVTNSESVILNGADGHTYVIVSVILCETAGADEVFNLYIDENAAGNDFELLSDQALAANATFVFNDRIILKDTDHLCCALNSSGNVDVQVNFLDQTR